MAMLTGGMAENYFISIFEHLAAMRKIKGPAALQMQGCWICERRRSNACHPTWLLPQRVQVEWQRVCIVLVWKTACHQYRSWRTLHFLWALMVCEDSREEALVMSLIVRFDTGSCVGRWLANITALEKCFWSQAAWQKWQLVHAPAVIVSSN